MASRAGFVAAEIRPAESAITAPANSIRRAVQIVIDHHTSKGHLLYGSKALEDALVRAYEGHEPDPTKAREKSLARLAAIMEAL